jgi:broad-specificity NMP kinase
MIVELFGSPGAGKSTFARALTARLREDAYRTEPILSMRPAEYITPLDSFAEGPIRPPPVTAAVLRRLTRPAIEMLRMAFSWSANFHNFDSGPVNLLKIMPPRKAIWSLRERQYIWRLSCSWCRASQARQIFVLDQAFVQVVHGLILRGQAVDETLIGRALDCIPEPDMLIRLQAPLEILEARLRERHSLQGRFERLLERDLQANLESVRIIDQLDELLQKRGWCVTRITSVNEESLLSGVERIATIITEKSDASQRQCAD